MTLYIFIESLIPKEITVSCFKKNIGLIEILK